MNLNLPSERIMPSSPILGFGLLADKLFRGRSRLLFSPLYSSMKLSAKVYSLHLEFLPV